MQLILPARGEDVLRIAMTGVRHTDGHWNAE
jgi:hypothetical protein